MRQGLFLTAVLLANLLLSACSPLEDPSLFPEFKQQEIILPAKPTVEYEPNRQLLWGDLHIHTSYSTDAYVLGVRATPDDAYTFARGGAIEHAAGYEIRIDRPLDFAAVTEHSEYMGAARADDSRTLPLEARDLRTRLLEDSRLATTWAMLRTVGSVTGLDYFSASPEIRAIGIDAWQLMIDTAQAHYEPGVFTTLVGYEWTSTLDGQNLHRNVIYRDTHVPELPFSSVDSLNPEDLWAALDEQRNAGMTMLAIPHNSNVSNGLMYDRVRFSGDPIDASYSAQRMRNEPISEILQIKGASETHPLLSPNDEFADFELFTSQLSASGDFSEPHGSYARDALRTGIEMSHSEGFNPYRFGVIGSSDSHNASTSVEEARHHGKLPLMDGTAGIRLGKVMLLPESSQRAPKWGAAGLAAVWATENTRESVYDALARRETYATSGPRIRLRFFGSFDYDPSLIENPELLSQAYQLGVPMGSELSIETNTRASAPQFLVWAAKDPHGANLDRIQIIKGWVDQSGHSQETIFNVAFSQDREIGDDGSVKPVGNTVNIAEASYSNTIGSAQLRAFWQDPEFDPEQESFYYARAIEIPTPRWSTYDAKRLGVEAPQPTSIQERAISSAIWYQALSGNDQTGK